MQNIKKTESSEREKKMMILNCNRHDSNERKQII